MANRRKFTLDEKRIVYAKYNGKCAICGQPVKFKKMTVDHKVPLSKGGTNAMVIHTPITFSIYHNSTSLYIYFLLVPCNTGTIFCV